MAEAVQSEAVEPVAPLAESVADHAAQFSPAAQSIEADLAASETPEETAARHHSATQKREQETGKFTEGHKRVRPSKDAAVRIEKAHAKVATAEERATAAEQRATKAEQALAEARRTHAPVSVIEKAEQKVAAAKPSTADPEPAEDDAKYGGDWSQYFKDHARWSARDELRTARQQDAEQRADLSRKEQEHAIGQAFSARVDAVKAQFPTLSKAMAWQAPWLSSDGNVRPGGELVDKFILEDENGPAVLDHLFRNAEEADELLRLSVPAQARRLSLIADQYSSSSGESAGSTTSVAPRSVVKPLPKPPNVVRTEAQRSSESEPTSAATSIDEHKRRFGKRA